MEVAQVLKRFRGKDASIAMQNLKVMVAAAAKVKPTPDSELSELQAGYTNFYADNAISPHVPFDGLGPWIVNSDGKVIYDTGGYGMLGFGHNHPKLLEAVGRRQVMANIMTPSFVQDEFWEKVKAELTPAYDSILCLNSGSEANTLAMRIANIHNHENPVRVALKGSFHGRTEAPATVSENSRAGYERVLADYNPDNKAAKERGPAKFTHFIEPNDEKDAIRVFNEIKARGEFPEITLFEPVMGEGNPGVPADRGFYETLRGLTSEHGGLLLADSVQAGWRVRGEMSFTKYADMDGVAPPDMETFSKAINGGQFPLSILALSAQLSNNYKSGIYGNTMCGNPRGLDVACAVLDELTPDVRENIRTSGEIFVSKLKALQNKYPTILEDVTGTGLLVALHVVPQYDVMDVEKQLRLRGLNVIHGGANALRFTPWFHMTPEESDFICELMDDYFAVMVSHERKTA
jgi:4-aminobutyrate aminotransferase-like enzyme